MQQAFDLRLNSDQEALANHFPNIDGHHFNISQQRFIKALANVSTFLNSPEWMVYQWGAFLPIQSGKSGFHLLLPEVVDLGIWLRHLSDFRNFDQLLVGFFNPTQFQDTLFEVKVAFFFSSLPSVQELIFSPEFLINDLVKHPEFEAVTQVGKIAVECKRPHLFAQERANETFRRVVDHFKSAMQEFEWPSHLRLEIDIVAPIREDISILAERVVQLALTINQEHNEERFSEGPFMGFVVERNSPFRIADAKLGSDVVILDKQVATGLFNSDLTALRVTNNRLDMRFAKSVGDRIREAVGQLPETHHCFIFVGDVPFRIAKSAIQRRLSDPAYAHVRAFGVWEGTVPNFIYRDSDTDFIEELLNN